MFKNTVFKQSAVLWTVGPRLLQSWGDFGRNITCFKTIYHSLYKISNKNITCLKEFSTIYTQYLKIYICNIQNIKYLDWYIQMTKTDIQISSSWTTNLGSHRISSDMMIISFAYHQSALCLVTFHLCCIKIIIIAPIQCYYNYYSRGIVFVIIILTRCSAL